MSSTTFFGNRGRAAVFEAPTSVTVTLTNGSTAYTASGAVAGDYVWLVADGQQFASRCASGSNLAYPYKGTGGTSTGYRVTPTDFQVLRGLNVEFGWEVKELYGTDSIFRVDEAKYNHTFLCSAKYCKWNPEVTVDWTMKVLRPSGATGVIEDVNTAYVHGAVYYIPGANGGVTEFVFSDVYYEGVPYPIPETDFIIREMKGHARKGVINSY